MLQEIVANEVTTNDTGKSQAKQAKRELQCNHCKRTIYNSKYFHFPKSICIACYETLYESFPCFDCFQHVERKRDQEKGNKEVHLCFVCRAQRLQMTTVTCSRATFECSKCATIHMIRCPLVHAADMNLPRHVHRTRQQQVAEYQPSNSFSTLDPFSLGFYFWHKFLFCSYRCVQRQFSQTTICVICAKEPAKLEKCHRCHIPLCETCAPKWFIQDSGQSLQFCIQCFIDLHPRWTQHDLHQKLMSCQKQNYSQILHNTSLPESMRSIILEFLVHR